MGREIWNVGYSSRLTRKQDTPQDTDDEMPQVRLTPEGWELFHVQPPLAPQAGAMTGIVADTPGDWMCFPATGGNWIGVSDELQLTIQSPTRATLMEDIVETELAICADLATGDDNR